MVATTDGFAIAEMDLKLRGPGEFFGTRQHGALGLDVANPLRDRELLETARREAFALAANPETERRAPPPAGVARTRMAAPLPAAAVG